MVLLYLFWHIWQSYKCIVTIGVHACVTLEDEQNNAKYNVATSHILHNVCLRPKHR